MKVILCKDVAKIGRRFDIVTVPDGYALNKLIPQKMAEPATSKNIDRVKARKDSLDQKHSSTQQQFEAIAEVVKNNKISLARSANDAGGLFQGLKPSDVAAAITEQFQHVVVPDSFIILQKPIKSVGEHSFEISFEGSSVSGVIDVTAE